MARQRTSALPTSGPSILWGDIEGMVKGGYGLIRVPTEADGEPRKAPCVLPVVIAGSQVSDVLLNEKVGLEERESG